MTVSPIPRRGIALEGRDQTGRVLRVASHAAVGKVVFSIWQDDSCRATVRLSPADVATLIGSLATILSGSNDPQMPVSEVG